MLASFFDCLMTELNSLQHQGTTATDAQQLVSPPAHKDSAMLRTLHTLMQRHMADIKGACGGFRGTLERLGECLQAA